MTIVSGVNPNWNIFVKVDHFPPVFGVFNWKNRSFETTRWHQRPKKNPRQKPTRFHQVKIPTLQVVEPSRPQFLLVHGQKHFFSFRWIGDKWPNIYPGSPRPNKEWVFRMIPIKDSRSYQSAKFGLWTSWVYIKFNWHQSTLKSKKGRKLKGNISEGRDRLPTNWISVFFQQLCFFCNLVETNSRKNKGFPTAPAGSRSTARYTCDRKTKDRSNYSPFLFSEIMRDPTFYLIFFG